MKTKLIVPVLVLTFLGLATIGVTRIYAESPPGKYPSIIQKLVSKFGLKENDVKAVFDEDRQERQSQMGMRAEERLTQAVKDGKLTEAQKQAILAKQKELQAKREKKPENWQNITPEERRKAMETQKLELETWAKQNNIDLKYLGGFGRGGFGMEGAAQRALPGGKFGGRGH